MTPTAIIEESLRERLARSNTGTRRRERIRLQTTGKGGVRRDLVLSGFMRVVTHPHVFETPSTLASATRFVAQLREQPNRVGITPGRPIGKFSRDYVLRLVQKGTWLPTHTSWQCRSRTAVSGSPPIAISADFRG